MNGAPWRLWSYIGRMFAIRFLVVFVVLITILQTLDLVGVSNAISAQHPGDSTILFSYLKLRIPTLAAQFLPFTVLIAALATFGGLAQTNEITSARSMGLTRLRIGLPMLVIAGLLGLLHLAASQTWALSSAASLTAWQSAEYKGRPSPTDISKKKPLWANDGDTIVHARDVAGDLVGLQLYDVQVISFDTAMPLTSVIFAKQGSIVNGVLKLTDAKKIAPPALAAPVDSTWQLPIKVDARDLQADRMKPKSAPLSKLIAAAYVGIPDKNQRHAIYAQIHHRFATVLLITLLPLAAIAVIGGQPRARNRLWNMAAGMALGFIFFVFDSVMFGIANSGTLPGWVAAWGTVALFFGVSYSLLLRSET
jgi:lipopolysaccharide export system permease protein